MNLVEFNKKTHTRAAKTLDRLIHDSFSNSHPLFIYSKSQKDIVSAPKLTELCFQHQKRAVELYSSNRLKFQTKFLSSILTHAMMKKHNTYVDVINKKFTKKTSIPKYFRNNMNLNLNLDLFLGNRFNDNCTGENKFYALAVKTKEYSSLALEESELLAIKFAETSEFIVKGYEKVSTREMSDKHKMAQAFINFYSVSPIFGKHNKYLLQTVGNVMFGDKLPNMIKGIESIPRNMNIKLSMARIYDGLKQKIKDIEILPLDEVMDLAQWRLMTEIGQPNIASKNLKDTIKYAITKGIVVKSKLANKTYDVISTSEDKLKLEVIYEMLSPTYAMIKQRDKPTKTPIPRKTMEPKFDMKTLYDNFGMVMVHMPRTELLYAQYESRAIGSNPKEKAISLLKFMKSRRDIRPKDQFELIQKLTPFLKSTPGFNELRNSYNIA